MNSFDLLIEKYRKELIDAKRKSIISAIDEDEAWENEAAVNADTQTSQAKPVALELEGTVQTSQIPQEQTAEVFSEQQEEAQPTALQQQEEAQVLEAQQEPAVSVNAPVEPRVQRIVPEVVEIERAKNTAVQRAVQEDADPSHGVLRVQVFAADRVYPIASALVKVTESGNEDNVFFEGYTDTSGIVDDIVLPAVSKSQSQTPGQIKPYSQYDITASHPRFITRKYMGVPVFEGVKSIQNIQLVPSFIPGESEITIEGEPDGRFLGKSGSVNG